MKEKNIPASLDDCTKAGFIPKRWWQMGSAVEIIGSVIMLLMELASIVAIVFVGVELVNEGMLNALTGFLFVFGALFACAFAAFIFFCIYKFMALILYTKSTVVYNSDVLANIAIKNSAEEKSGEEE